jgi:hypothetical protein
MRGAWARLDSFPLGVSLAHGDSFQGELPVTLSVNIWKTAFNCLESTWKEYQAELCLVERGTAELDRLDTHRDCFWPPAKSAEALSKFTALLELSWHRTRPESRANWISGTRQWHQACSALSQAPFHTDIRP